MEMLRKVLRRFHVVNDADEVPRDLVPADCCVARLVALDLGSEAIYRCSSIGIDQTGIEELLVFGREIGRESNVGRGRSLLKLPRARSYMGATVLAC